MSQFPVTSLQLPQSGLSNEQGGLGFRTNIIHFHHYSGGLGMSHNPTFDKILGGGRLSTPPRQGRQGRWARFKRLIRLRLFIPMMRGAHRPEFTARGVATGVFWAMTPTFGIQMGLVFAHWVAARRLFSWDFSLINGLAWTWITNAFTILPAYYLFYITGQLMLGESGNISGYETFTTGFAAAIDPQAGFFTQIGQGFMALLTDLGWPLLVGSIPWAILSTIIAYRAALNFVTGYREQRLARFKQARLKADA